MGRGTRASVPTSWAYEYKMSSELGIEKLDENILRAGPLVECPLPSPSKGGFRGAGSARNDWAETFPALRLDPAEAEEDRC